MLLDTPTPAKVGLVSRQLCMCWEDLGGSDRKLRSAHLLLVCQEVLFQGCHFLLEGLELLLFSCQHLEVTLVLLLPLQHLVAHLLQLLVEGLHLLRGAK